MSWFAAGEWLYELASYDKSNPNAEAQVEAAYLLTYTTLSAHLERYATFRDYFDELSDGNQSNLYRYLELYDSLDANTQGSVDAWSADVTNLVVEARRLQTADVEMLARLEPLLDPNPSADSSSESEA
jgi:hypothetical protein